MINALRRKQLVPMKILVVEDEKGIEAQSTLGNGSLFRITLPIATNH